MAFGSEVTGKLGIDTGSVPADLARAKQAMQKFNQEVGAGAGHAGDNAGEKLVGGIEHRIFGARHLSGALATALGLNIEHIAKGITAAIVGGTEEAWKQMGELAEENAKLIQKKMELALTPKQLTDKHKKDLEQAAKEEQSTGKQAVGEGKLREALIGQEGPVVGRIIGFLAEKLGGLNSKADLGVKLAQKQKDTLEADVKVAEEKKAVLESHKKLAEFEADLTLKNLSGTKLIAALDLRRAEIQKEINSGKLSEIEIDEHKKKADEIGVQIAAEKLRLDQEKIEKARELERLGISANEAAAKLARDEEDLANKKADRGKETIDEIADLKPAEHKIEGPAAHVDTFGLDAAAAQAKEQAVEIQRLQKQGESLRRAGDVGGANAVFDQISTKKQSLVDSGFAKSSEGDEFKKIGEEIHKDNVNLQKILAEIKVVAQGKLKNQ